MINRNLWNKAKKAYPPKISEKESSLIIISSSLGAVVSLLISKIDFNKIESITKIGILDLLIYAFLLAFLFMAFVKIVLWLQRGLDILSQYLIFRWKTKKLKHVQRGRKN